MQTFVRSLHCTRAHIRSKSSTFVENSRNIPVGTILRILYNVPQVFYEFLRGRCNSRTKLMNNTFLRKPKRKWLVFRNIFFFRLLNTLFNNRLLTNPCLSKLYKYLLFLLSKKIILFFFNNPIYGKKINNSAAGSMFISTIHEIKQYNYPFVRL